MKVSQYFPIGHKIDNTGFYFIPVNIEHEQMKLLKDIETRKLYFLINGKKGNYAGKQSKKGKIKLK